MPIILTTCNGCGQRLEIDAAHTLILKGSTEAVWRAIRAKVRPGHVVDPQTIADNAFLARVSVYAHLHRLAHYGLLISRNKRKDANGNPHPDGKHKEFLLPERSLPLVITPHKQLSPKIA